MNRNTVSVGEVMMNKKKWLRSRRKGAALLLVLFAVVMLSLMGMGLLNLGQQSRIRAVREGHQTQARCAADAGLVHAVFSMNQNLQADLKSVIDKASSQLDLLDDASFASVLSDDTQFPLLGEQVLTGCGTTFSYKVTANTLSGNQYEYVVISKGQAGQAQRTVYAIIGLRGLFDSAILGSGKLSLMPNTIISGYNSQDPTDTDIDLKMGTTSIAPDSIPLGPGTVVNGDVFVGVGGDPQTAIGAGGTVTGDKYSLIEEPGIPVIVAPDLPDMGMGLHGKGATIKVTPDKSGKYTDIDLSKGASPGVLEVTGGDVVLHITGNIELKQGCEIVIRPDSSLTLYVDGDIHADNSMGFNNEASSTKALELYATGEGSQVFDLKAKSAVFGIVYAPQADINMYPCSEIHGVIVGKNIDFKSKCKFYYDEALRRVTVSDEGVRFVVKQWREL